MTPTEKPVRVAVVGASGWAGSRHVASFARAGADLVALIDPHPSTVRLAAIHQSRVMGSVDELSSDEVDLVVVSLPSSMQPTMCAGLLRRGVRVLVEKPIAPVAAEADILLTVPGLHDNLMVGYTLHHHPAAAMLRDWVAQGDVVAASVRSVARKTSLGTWRADPREGGVTVVNGIHAIEMIASFWGEPIVRDARSSSGLYSSGIAEYVAATLEFPAGPVFRLETYWSPWDNTRGINNNDWDLQFDILGRRGRRVWHNWSYSSWDRGGQEVTRHIPETDLFDAQAASALDFARGGAPLVGFRQALRATAIADRILAAISAPVAAA